MSVPERRELAVDAASLAVLVAVERAVQAALYDALPPALADLMAGQQVQARLADWARAGARADLVVVDGQPVGVFVVRHDPDLTHLHLLDLLPAWQARGLGSTLIRQELALAGARGVPVTLQVLRTNRAQALYDRLGFVPDGPGTDVHLRMRWTG